MLGFLLGCHAFSEALDRGFFSLSRLHVDYGAFQLYVNGSTDLWEVDSPRGRLLLPSWGWAAWSADGKMFESSALSSGERADYCVTPDYEYLDGRGTLQRMGKLACAGGVVMTGDSFLDIGANTEIGFKSAAEGGQVEAFDANYQPLADEHLPEGRLIAEVFVPGRHADGGERIEQYTVTRRKDSLFEARIPVDSGGEYRLRVKDPITQKYAEANFRVTDLSAERRSAVRNVALQTDLARVHPGGRALELADAGKLADDIQSNVKEEPTIQVLQIWSTWPMFLFVIGLMVAEWLVRKRNSWA